MAGFHEAQGEGIELQGTTASQDPNPANKSVCMPTSEQVERWLKNYQQLNPRLEEICELNQKLLRPEE
jgi:hypothetical protein